MELKIAATELAKALGRSQGIVEKKWTMPILSHVLLEAKKGISFVVSATDLDLAVSSEHKALRGPEGGRGRGLGPPPLRHRPLAARAAGHAQEGAQQLPRGAERPVRVPIVGLPAEDFPALPRFDKVPFGDVKPELLLEMIERTFFAVSTDETRYNLNGVYFEPSGETAAPRRDRRPPALARRARRSAAPSA